MIKNIKILFYVLLFTNIISNAAFAQEFHNTRCDDGCNEDRVSLRLNLDASLQSRNRNFGAAIAAELSLDAEWALADIRLSQGFIVPGDNRHFVLTEITGYAHLLAVGISNFSYIKYLSGSEKRILGGFSYSRHVGGTVRVDVNLGLSYFNLSTSDSSNSQYGIQLGTRIISNFWHIHNEFFITGYQNVKLNDANLDFSGTRIVCSAVGSDLECVVPPGDSSGSAGIVSWEHAGVIIENNAFINAYETSRCQIGPVFIFRYENLPFVGRRFWSLLGLRIVFTN